jgi:hypothetical protein
MSPSNRSRTSGTKAAQDLLPPGTVIYEYTVGRAHARVTMGAVVSVAVFLVAFIVALAMGTILIPGALLLFYGVHAVRPVRAVVVTSQGLVVMEKSFVNGRPTKIVGSTPMGPLRTVDGEAVALDLGGERISFSSRETDRLRRALVPAWR